MKYCSKCGEQNPDEAKFCKACGEPFVMKEETQTKHNAATVQSSSGSSGGKVIVIIFVIIAAIIGIVVHNNNAREKAELEAQHHYLSALDSNGPSGFQEGHVDFDYPIYPNECLGVTYYGYEWRYDEQCYVRFTLMKCHNNENIYGFAIYYGPNIRQTSFHKAKVEGFLDDNDKWKFETYDQDGNLYDKYEGKWIDRKTFSGVCTNRRGRKMQFKGIDYID